MLLAFRLQLYCWYSYRTSRHLGEEAWVLEFVPVCLKEKEKPLQTTGKAELPCGSRKDAEACLMMGKEALCGSPVTAALDIERTPWSSFKDFVTVTWTSMKVTSGMVAALWGSVRNTVDKVITDIQIAWSQCLVQKRWIDGFCFPTVRLLMLWYCF